MKKSLTILFALAVFASVFLYQTAYASTEPWNVEANICHCGKTYSYNLRNEIPSFADNASARGFYLGKNGKTALAERLMSTVGDLSAVQEYLLPGFFKIVGYFRFVEADRIDATVTFDENGFSYFHGRDGIAIDSRALFRQMLQSTGKKTVLNLPVVVDKAVTVEELKQNTVKKGSFSTSYSSNESRCSNVRLAVKSLNGVTVQVGEKFSFNEIVGPRTVERGYKTAKVISNGVYVDGVGGGVCQVSTTLYNALLLSEIVPSACQHSLVSSYVEAGFDAMVSDSGADLTFVNDTGAPLYVSASTDSKNNRVKFTVFGKPNRYNVTRESVFERTAFDTVEIIDEEKYPELIFSDQFKVIVNGSDGVKSRSFLNYFDGDRLVKRVQIRSNVYKKVDKVVARGKIVRQTEN